MTFTKDNPQPGPGRPLGLSNAITTQLKEMIRQALDNAGGVLYLTEQASINPVAFLTLLGKTLPSEMRVDVTKREIRVNISLNGGPQSLPMAETIDSVPESCN